LYDEGGRVRGFSVWNKPFVWVKCFKIPISNVKKVLGVTALFQPTFCFDAFCKQKMVVIIRHFQKPK